MNFADHVDATRQPDGTYDLAVAEVTRATELAADSADSLAAKAAHAERKQWERSEGDRLRKCYEQPVLDPSLDRDLKVKLGDNVVVRMGEMNLDRIRLRLDLRTQVHVRELRAFANEVDFYGGYAALLDPSERIDDLF
jgi:hypothetical protein